MFRAGCTLTNLYCGVEQLAAREAHNLEVAGSNPVPASGPNAAQRGGPPVNVERRGRPASAFALYLHDEIQGYGLEGQRTRLVARLIQARIVRIVTVYEVK